jgi:ABC-type uncharacterized transport system auxiliary subunit
MKNKIIVLTVALYAAMMGGCAAARPSQYYQLSLPDQTAPAANVNPLPVTLLIAPISASHLYREDVIVYSTGGESMGTYRYHRWAEPPTEMIQAVLQQQLRASGAYRGVYALHSNERGDYLVRGQLMDLKEVSTGAVVARLTLELEMRDMKTDQIVWTHFYTHDEPVSTKEVAAVVEALDKNVQRAAAEFQSSLGQYFAAHPPTN